MSESTLKSPANKTDHYKGSLEAPIVLVEYADFECPLSAEAVKVVENLLHDYKNDICYVFRHFPLTEAHPHSGVAAVASEAANEQDLFWPMYDALFENQHDLSTENIFSLAKAMHMDMHRFLIDIEDDTLFDRVRRDFNIGAQSGVERTPTFFINGIRHVGKPTYQELQTEIELILRDNQIFI